VVSEGSLLCLEIRCGLKCRYCIWRFAVVLEGYFVVSGDSLCCLKCQCGVWSFAVLPVESVWCL